ncbi:hypothetical protein F4775DRAFT_9868 [Biscogniauxia sp. FL1348]|nr:hypothetical protein F4775DRAFT_9868 [Biscogniauxia sp. FL1348]
MACRSCRRQLNLLARQTNAVAHLQNAAAPIASRRLTLPAPARFEQRRGFASTPRQASGLMEKIGAGVGKAFARSTEPYRVLKATEDIYKACSRGALYTVNPADLKAGTIPKTEDGEDVGEGSSMWHKEFNLPPTFSTWSQVTMLHMYLIYARLRNLDREAARSWQAQLVDHFFFDAEERMDLSHGISSRVLRQQYLKDLFVQWRGVVVAYDEGVAKGDTVLASAVWRNVFKAREDVDVRALAAIVSWMRLCLKMLDQMTDEALFFRAETALRWPANNELAFVDKPTKELQDQLVQQQLPASLAGATTTG